MNPKLNRLWWILRIGFGAIFVVSGTDKFLNLMTYWPMYVSETFAQVLPLSAQNFMYLVGIIELLTGLAILTKPTRIGAYVATAWMLGVAVNLLTAGLYDLAARDVAIGLGAFGLAQLTEVLHGVPASDRHRPHRPAHAMS